MRIVVVSCPSRKPIQAIWRDCFLQSWGDCQFVADILSPNPDVGWNVNLLNYLSSVADELILMFLDDHFLSKSAQGYYTAEVGKVVALMESHPEIGLIKLQAGNAWPPELEFTEHPDLREYDREPHPFKRTNLVPTLFRKSWLIRMLGAVRSECGVEADCGRNGALRFEQDGTRLTMDAKQWPERMLGIHRPNPDGGGYRNIVSCTADDGVREGRLRAAAMPELATLVDVRTIAGIEAFA